MNRRYFGWILFFAALVPGLPRAQQPLFYISTEKIYSPGEEARVTVEARGLEYVDLRVYQIPDPLQFFLDQQDLHQPREKNKLGGRNTLEILEKAYAGDLAELRRFSRTFLQPEARRQITDKYSELRGTGKTPAEGWQHASLPFLKKYKLVRHFRHGFTSRGEWWNYETIPVGTNAPGTYLVEGSSGEEAAYTLVVVSRLALITKQSGTALVCQVVDKLSGEPVPEARITVLHGATRKNLAEGATGPDGLFRTPLRDVSEIKIIASSNGQFALMDPAFFPVSVPHRKVYIYTDRPVYRPSQEVFFKGIVREMTDEKYRVLSSLPVKIGLYDPGNTLLASKETKLSDMGSFTGSFQLPESPRLGTYRIVAEIESKPYQGEFKIEAYKKPKFQVDVKLQGSGLNGGQVQAQVEARYYFGTPVRAATVEYFVYRTRFYVPWWVDEQFSWYYSEAEYRNTRQELITQGTGMLDGNGRFSFTFDTPADARDYTYRVEARVRDQSQFTMVGDGTIKTSKGLFTIDLQSDRLIYSPGQSMKLRIQTRDLNNQPSVARVTVKLWQQNLSAAGAPDLLLLTQEFSTGKTGSTELPVPLKGKGYLKLVAESQDSLKNKIQNTLAVWVTDLGEAAGYGGKGLEVVANQRSYQVGDTARLLILSETPDVPFLFTIEGGDLYQCKLLRFKGNACVVDFPVETLHTPNVFVQACYIHDDQFYQQKRTLIVPPADQFLDISLKPGKEVYRPGEQVTVDIAVRNRQGKAVQAEVSLGVVDEAIYAISPELAIEMQKFFYYQKRNNVRTYNSLTFNFYGYSENAKERLAALDIRPDTGYGNMKTSRQKIRRNFKDTCYWLPALMTSKTGKAQVTFQLPDNITRWRLTARAVNYFTQVGTVTGQFISRKDLFTQTDPPATFTQGDQLVLPVTIQNTTNQLVSGQLKVIARGAELTGPAEVSFNLSGQRNQVVLVPLKITDHQAVTLGIRVAGGNQTDEEELTVPVTPYRVEKASAVNEYWKAADPAKTVVFEMPGTDSKMWLGAKVYVHSGLFQAIQKNLEYLLQYPYGCVEQTMSGFLPDVILKSVLKKHQLNEPELEKKVDAMVAGGISRLLDMQDQKRHCWGWWEDSQSDAYMTAYVLYGLALAREAGYPVPDGPVRGGVAWLKNRLFDGISPEMEAFAHYVIALHGDQPDKIRLRAMFDRRTELSPYAVAMLAMAHHRAGFKTEAETLAQRLLVDARRAAEGEEISWDGQITYHDNSYEAPVESTAAAIQALLLTHPDHPAIMQGIRWLLRCRQGDRWNSTRDTALAVAAISAFLRDRPLSRAEASAIRVRLNGGVWREIPAEALGLGKTGNIIAFPVPELHSGKNLVELTRDGQFDLYVDVTAHYYSSDDEVATRSGPLAIQREYFRLIQDGGKFSAKALDSRQQLQFAPGEEFLVELTVRPQAKYEYMMIEDFIPAGFQIIEYIKGYEIVDHPLDANTNAVLEDTDHIGQKTPPVNTVSYQESRDNRKVFFFQDLSPPGPVTVRYLLRAALPGQYNINPAVVSSMYYPDQRALSGRARARVAEEKNP